MVMPDLVSILIPAYNASCDETIFHLNMVKDTLQEMAGTFEPFIKPYEELSSKIYRFIEYVYNHWNKNL